VLSNKSFAVALSGLASCTVCKCLDQAMIVVAEACLYVFVKHIVISVKLLF